MDYNFFFDKTAAFYLSVRARENGVELNVVRDAPPASAYELQNFSGDDQFILTFWARDDVVAGGKGPRIDCHIPMGDWVFSLDTPSERFLTKVPREIMNELIRLVGIFPNKSTSFFVHGAPRLVTVEKLLKALHLGAILPPTTPLTASLWGGGQNTPHDPP